MPVMDGFQAVAHIREKEQTTGKHQQVIAMTAHAMKGDKERCLQTGMDGYLSKPIDRGSVEQTIQQVMSRSARPKPRILDEERLLDRLGQNPVLLNSVIDVFESDRVRLFSAICKAMDQRNMSALQESAHTLKGAVSTLGAITLTEQLQTLENLSRECDFDAATTVVKQLDSELNTFSSTLHQLQSRINK